MARVAVIGHGKMGRNHARVLGQLGHTVVTVDPDPAACATLIDNKLPVGFQVACIAVPIPKLADTARRALMLGMDVLVEKPGAETVGELAALHALAAERGHHLFVAYTERFNPAVAKAADLMHLVGEVRHVSARRLGRAIDRGHDAVLDLAVHDLDVLDRLGFTLNPVAAVGDHAHVSALLTAGATTSLTPTVSLEASHLHPTKVRTLEIVGTNATLTLDYSAKTVRIDTAVGGATAYRPSSVEPLEQEWIAFDAGVASTGIAALRAAEALVPRHRSYDNFDTTSLDASKGLATGGHWHGEGKD